MYIESSVHMIESVHSLANVSKDERNVTLVCEILLAVVSGTTNNQVCD